MLQRQTAISALKRIPPPPKTPLREFVDWLERAPSATWSTAADRARRDVPNDIETMALALWTTGDVLLRTNLMRTLDPARPDELAVIGELIGRARGAADAPALRAALERRHPDVIARIARKRAVPPALRAEADALRHATPRG
jgi:hypothetical protein